MPGPLAWCFLGRVPYDEALALQLRLRDAVREGRRDDVLLFLEHPWVITLGRSASDEHVRASPAQLAAAGVELRRVGRGGQVTLHGPGQLVGYPLRRLRSHAVRPHVRGLVEGLRSYLEEAFGLDARWEEDNPGLWIGAGKIAAVGVDARGGVAMHGFALNLSIDLTRFDLIVPCGLGRPVTSVAQETGRRVEAADAAPLLAEKVAAALGTSVYRIDHDLL